MTAKKIKHPKIEESKKLRGALLETAKGVLDGSVSVSDANATIRQAREFNRSMNKTEDQEGI